METPVDVTLHGEDVDGDALDFEVVAAPVHGELSGVAPTLTYTPDIGFYGLDALAYRAKANGAFSEPAFVLLVVEGDDEEVPDAGSEDGGGDDQDAGAPGDEDAGEEEPSDDDAGGDERYQHAPMLERAR